MKLRGLPVFLMCVGTLISAYAHTAGKSPAREPAAAPTSGGKRVIALSPIRDVQIELPDETLYDFGQAFQIALGNRFTQGGKFIVSDPLVTEEAGRARIASALTAASDEYTWPASVTPAATVRIRVDALSFRTGSRGTRMMYGFDERMRTPFNDGFGTAPNEFPLRSVTFEPNWFDRYFDAKGGNVYGSLGGLDLGEGFRIDAIFAWLGVKYATYRSELHLTVEIDAPLAGRRVTKALQVKGKGFFFDVVAGYAGYTAGIRLARRDAMTRAMNAALDGAFDSIQNAMGGLPLAARVDGVLADESVLIGAGADAGVPIGTEYEAVEVPGLRLKVIGSYRAGSRAVVSQGALAQVRKGLVLREAGVVAPLIAALGSARVSAVSSRLTAAALPITANVEIIELPWKNLPKTDLSGKSPQVSWTQALWYSVVEGSMLPYRIWRYFQYDKAYSLNAETESDESPVGEAPTERPAEEPRDTDLPANYARTTREWAQAMAKEPFAAQIGLDRVPPMAISVAGRGAPVVAVIDTGVDYNHPVIHDALWLNPSPTKDPSGNLDRYGWDFVSGDSRPSDDGYHGTQVASLVLAVAPGARIMALKAFNPWGVTSSAALYQSIVYAANHGARIILCPWATRLSSRALELGVSYARSRGALVVTAAGDRGDRLSEVAAYPAVLSSRYENLVTVASVDYTDHLVSVSGRFSNYDPAYVQIAAPGLALRVAEPRVHFKRDTSSGLSAALVAGALAREWAAGDGSEDALAWKRRVLEQAEPVAGLQGKVEGARRLRVAR